MSLKIFEDLVQGTPEWLAARHVSKGMGRFIAAIWGNESDEWVGKALTLYRDPDVKYAGYASRR